MAPRRNNINGSTALDLFGLDTDITGPQSADSMDLHNSSSASSPNTVLCCVPTGDCFKINNMNYGFIYLDDLSETVRVVCNNENCSSGQYMHRECFEQWEQTILSYLKSNGRARSWSDRQRQQNLWTKKGYDLAFKACNCKCGRGHLKKDLDWIPPASPTSIFGRIDDEASKKKKKRSRNNQKPALTMQQSKLLESKLLVDSLFAKIETPSNIRGRAGSLSSSNGSSSPAASSSEQSVSPIHNISLNNCNPNNHMSNISISCNSSSSGISPGSMNCTQSPKSQVEIYSDKIR